MTVPDETTLGQLSLLGEQPENRFKIIFNDMKVTPIGEEMLTGERPCLHNFAVKIRGRERGWWQIVRGNGRWAARWLPNT